MQKLEKRIFMNVGHLRLIFNVLYGIANNRSSACQLLLKALWSEFLYKRTKRQKYSLALQEAFKKCKHD
jgi:hypothetical protein